MKEKFSTLKVNYPVMANKLIVAFYDDAENKKSEVKITKNYGECMAAVDMIIDGISKRFLRPIADIFVQMIICRMVHGKLGTKTSNGAAVEEIMKRALDEMKN